MSKSAKQYRDMKAGSPDNFQTEPAALDFLVPYLPQKETIWECAAGQRNLVRGLEDRGYTVFASDIADEDMAIDFLNFDSRLNGLEDISAIVTNPPFTMKERFMGRCYNLGKPFALLMPITTFDHAGRRSLMDEFGVEVILPSRRIKFETPNHKQRIADGKKPGSAWFYSAWFTWGLNIGRQLTFSVKA